MPQLPSCSSGRDLLLGVNGEDCNAARGRVDDGTLDRLRLDDARVEGLARQLETMAGIEPLEREAGSWTLPNGLRVSERRIPIGTVGANFEARPNVALDVAGQLLKSLNTTVLRTGKRRARHGHRARGRRAPARARERPGCRRGAVGLVRSPDREGARLLVSLPRHIPLVILRGSGETTAALARLAAENGVRTLAHAEGGGVLYVHGVRRSRQGARARRREPRPARRLQPPEPRPRRSRGRGPRSRAARAVRRQGARGAGRRRRGAAARPPARLRVGRRPRARRAR